MKLHRLRGHEGIVERRIFCLAHRTIDVIVVTFSVTAGAIRLAVVDGFRIDNRADGVVEIKIFDPTEFPNGFGKSSRRQRSTRDDGNAAIVETWNFSYFLPDKF